jgi:chromosome partitioning protein
MSKIVTLSSVKGGSAKSTISINLAVEASLRGQKVLIIDTDPQESVFGWGQDRKKSWPLVVKSTAGEISGIISDYKNAADLIIIDTPPHSGTVIDQIYQISDLILVPVRPSRFDIMALNQTAEKIDKSQKIGRVILTHCRSRGTINDDTEEVIQNNCPNLPVLKSRISYLNGHTDPHLEELGTTELSNSVGGKAKIEIQNLYKEIKKGLKKWSAK